MVRPALRALCLCAALPALPALACEQRSLSTGPSTSAAQADRAFGRPRCITREDLVEMRRRDGLPLPPAREPDPPSAEGGGGPVLKLPVFVRQGPGVGI